MSANVTRVLLAAFIIGTTTNSRLAADEENEPERKQPFSIKLVDNKGKPVEGSIAGVTAYFGIEVSTLPLMDESGWRYWHGATSDNLGIARLAEGGNVSKLCLVARHAGRKLVAIEKIDPDRLIPEKTTGMHTITLYPECRVSGRLACRELSERNRDLGWITADLDAWNKNALGCSSRDGTFHFHLPPGEFKLRGFANDTHVTVREITVKSGQRELELGEIKLFATRLALLEGLPAPEFGEFAAWKNGPPVKLADLKGKLVLVEFWGYWCGPCVHSLPSLFELYDRYHERGLEIVGIHIDLGENEKEPVDSVEKLDGRLTAIRSKLWKGRDVPFPTAVVTGKRVPYGADVQATARSSISAEFGVTGYPTTILIDRKGVVVGQFHVHRPDDVVQLEKLLGDKSD